MPDSLDALEMRDAHAPEAPATPLEDVMFPALPAGVDDTDYTRGVNERTARARSKAAALLILKQQGYTRREIGRMLGMTANAVRVALNRARATGRLNDLRSVLENDSLALAIEGLNHHLRKKDKDAVFKTLEGLGHFRNYNNSKMEGGAGFVMPSLSVTIVNAPNAGEQMIVSQPVGQPRVDKPAAE